MTRNKVFGLKPRPSENALRDALAQGLALVQGASTDGDAADALCISIGTVRNIRNRHNTASLKVLSDGLYGAGADFIQAFLALHGLKAVLMADPGQTCDASKVCTIAQALAMIAAQTAPDSAGGTMITDAELRKIGPQVRAGQEAMNELAHRLHVLDARA